MKIDSGWLFSEPRFPISPVHRQRQPDLKLAVAAIVKNEEAYLSEWMEFHAMLGVEQFAIYDNDSTDSTATIVDAYVRKGLAVRYPWPSLQGWPSQKAAYAHATMTLRQQVRWLAFLDIDEFLFPQEGRSLVETLAESEAFAAVRVNWRNFGHGGHRRKPPGPVIASYRHRMEGEPASGFLRRKLLKVKTIADPCRITEIDVHSPAVEGLETSGGGLLLNHYFTRSREEFDAKVARGASYKRSGKQAALAGRRIAMRDAIEASTMEDLAIQRFVPELLRRLDDPPGGMLVAAQ
jgi:hypothetical protein